MVAGAWLREAVFRRVDLRCLCHLLGHQSRSHGGAGIRELLHQRINFGLGRS